MLSLGLENKRSPAKKCSSNNQTVVCLDIPYHLDFTTDNLSSWCHFRNCSFVLYNKSGLWNYYTWWTKRYCNRSDILNSTLKVRNGNIFSIELPLNILKIVFSSFLIMIGLFIISSLFTNRKDIDLCIVFINHAYEYLAVFKTLGLLIPLFLVLMLGLVALFGFQLLAFWSYSTFKH